MAVDVGGGVRVVVAALDLLLPIVKDTRAV